MLDRYIAALYVRYTLLILAALLVFFAGLDLINNLSSLPESANLILLYVLFRAAKALEIVLPLSCVFGAVGAKIQLIRTNELVAIYSLGASRLAVLRPFAVVSLVITLIYIAANTTEFAYASDRADAIKENRFFASATEDLFLKYNNSYIYIKELYPLQNRAKFIDILEVENEDLTRYIRAENASFINDEWRLEDVTVVHKPPINALQDEGIRVERLAEMTALRDFRPDIMDAVYESKIAYSLKDAVGAWRLFADQQINTDKIRAVFYATITTPLFAPIFVVIIFFFVPISPRFFNVALFSSLAVLFVLVSWGALFVLSSMAKNGAVAPELALLLPFAIAAGFAGRLIRRAI